MTNNPFQTRQPSIANNLLLRAPQREAYAMLVEYAAEGETEQREAGIERWCTWQTEAEMTSARVPLFYNV